jgi:hypothetical protein
VNGTIAHRGMLTMSLAAALVFAWALPVTASAATQLGQVSPVDHTGTCGAGNTVQAEATEATTPPYTVPAAGGVITSWSHKGTLEDPGSGRLQIWRNAGGLNFTLVARSALRDFTAGVNTFPTRIPVAGGELLGFLTAAETETGCSYVGAAGDRVAHEGPTEAAPDETRTMMFAFGDLLLNVSARLEPDGDGDGFGDESQDDCPGQAGPSNGCPPGTSPPPDDGSPPPDDGLPPPDDGLPSNEFSFGKAKKNKRKGTAKLTVEVPGPGELELARTKKVKQDTEQVEATVRTAQDGIEVKLKVKPKGKARKKLNRKGKAKVKAQVTFTPDGGEPNTESKRVGLKKR